MVCDKDRFIMPMSHICGTDDINEFSVLDFKLVHLHFLYVDRQMHNYFTNYHPPTCIDNIASSSGHLESIPCKVTQVFQMQLLIIQFVLCCIVLYNIANLLHYILLYILQFVLYCIALCCTVLPTAAFEILV